MLLSISSLSEREGKGEEAFFSTLVDNTADYLGKRAQGGGKIKEKSAAASSSPFFKCQIDVGMPPHTDAAKEESPRKGHHLPYPPVMTA